MTLSASNYGGSAWQTLEYEVEQFTETGEVPVRGQGKKKPQGDKDAIELAEYLFRDAAKNGELNLPLDQPGI